MKNRLIMVTLLSTLLVSTAIGGSIIKSNKVENSAIGEVNIDDYISESYNDDIISTDVDNIDDSNDLLYLGEFLLTGYCDCEICQEEWVGTTALGYAPEENWTIAVDPDVIPLGSYVWINGTRYHAEDVGGMINENHIDIFCGSHEECYGEFCNGYAEVFIEVEDKDDDR